MPWLQIHQGKSESYLMEASMEGHFEVVKLLLESRADPHKANEVPRTTPISTFPSIYCP